MGKFECPCNNKTIHDGCNCYCHVEGRTEDKVHVVLGKKMRNG